MHTEKSMASPPEVGAVLEAAMDYAGRGWKVIPIEARGKKPLCGKQWQDFATSDTSVAENWFSTTYRGCSIGLVFGRESNLIDVECDSAEAEQELREIFGDDLPIGPTYQSSRGKHRLFKWRSDLPRVAVLKYRGVEFRIGGPDENGKALAAQSVAPPSIHASGKAYQWLPGLSPDDCDPPELPDCVVKLLREACGERGGGTGAGKTSAAKLARDGAREGARNQTLASYVGHLWQRFDPASGDDLRLVLEIALDWNEQRSNPPLPRDEVRATVESIAKRERKSGKRRRRRGKGKRGDDGGGGNAGADGGGDEEGKQNANDLDPATTALAFLQTKAVEGLSGLVLWRDDFYLFDPLTGAWKRLSTGEVEAEIIKFLNASYCNVGRSPVGNVLAQVKALTILPNEVEPPTWIARVEQAAGWAPTEIIAARNGLIHVPTWARQPGRGHIAPTAAYFTTCTLPFDIRPDAPRPTAWLKFLDDLFGTDTESIQALQEWMGYCLLPDVSMQKIAMLIGPKRSGKGTIAHVLRGLVGSQNFSGPTLAGLATNFGLQALIDSTVACIADARLGKHHDRATMVERLLMTSGGDIATVDRKYKAPWVGRLRTRLMILSNVLPDFADEGGALAKRMLIFRLQNSFFGKEDTTLFEAKLRPELPLIAVWAIEGWARLKERGKFTEPSAAIELVEELEEYTSPVGRFVHDCLEINPKGWVFVDLLLATYRLWARGQHLDDEMSAQRLGRALRAEVPGLQVLRPHKGQGGRNRVYKGIRIAPDAGAIASDAELCLSESEGYQPSGWIKKRAEMVQRAESKGAAA